MPCRAAPPPPPPPHSTQDLTPSPAALSNPLVYRLRTCCLQEFLPRVSLVQKSSSQQQQQQSRPRSSPTQLSILFNSQDHNSNFHPHLSSHHHYPSASPHSPNSQQHPDHRQEHVRQEQQHDEAYASPQQQQQYPSNEEDRDVTNSLSAWQPPASNIQLAHLQSTLAHRFLDWALSKDILSLPSSSQEQEREVSEPAENNTSTTADGAQESSPLSDAAKQQRQQLDREQRERSIVSAGQDWAAAHDLVWPEGDYYMAKKTFIREGVAHLKRGRRYIFVEPVLGPATSYLYPKWVDSEEDEEEESHGAEDHMHVATATVDTSLSEAPSDSDSTTDSNNNSDGDDALALPSMAAALTSSLAADEDEQDKDQDDDHALVSEEGHGNDKGEREEEDKEEEKEEAAQAQAQENQHHDSGDSSSAITLEDDRAQDGLVAPLSPPLSTTTTTLGGMDGERIEKEEAEDTSATSPPSSTGPSTAATATAASNNNANNPSTATPPSSSSSTSSSFEEAPSSPLQQQQQQQHQSSDFLEPYSPLLDPSTDGQDQFEYGLYELQFIPKIQYLLPSQFLPSRQSFIVHLDEERPTLASPVPANSKRSECRCQLMMRKVLMHRNLLEVWPPIPPCRTLQERQQDEEEEARMMEIKQKVQLQTSNWRKTLQTQMVACR
ncbi:MAG: hypothetical protein J3R72DRAFT_76552 [Linnemannia gamsii]|nr:MAG: hypothetical protein J3R72DRAFT_76552 [Linnemannia gamsii]